jgi:hypothetical protein
MLNREGYAAGLVGRYLDRAKDLMPPDVPKQHLSQFFNIRGIVRVNLGDRPGAIRDLETAVSVWPVPDNGAIKVLEGLYAETGDESALKDLRYRVKPVRHPGH